MNIRRKAFSIGTSAALLASLLATVVAPTAFAAASPASGPVGGGTTVTITGTGFTSATTLVLTAPTSGTCFTTPLTTTNTSVAAGGTSLTFVTPSASGCGTSNLIVAGTGSYAVTTAVAGTADASTTFTYNPTVTSIAPTTGATAGGTAVTITGTAFAATAGLSVTIGGVAATSIIGVSATSITAVTGAHPAGLANVVVTNTVSAASGTLANGYRYSDTGGTAPTVTLVAPATGPTAGATPVTITGTNFGLGASVTFDGIPATGVGVGSSTSLVATTPAHAAGLVNVVVTNADALSGTGTGLYTYTGAPPLPPPSALTNFTFTVTGAGSVPTTGVTGVVSIFVGEGFATGWGNIAAPGTPNTLTFTLPSTATWTGTPAISGNPSSLGTFTISGVGSNVLSVNFTQNNPGQVENFTIGGMTITTVGAAVGPLPVTVAHPVVGTGGTGTIPFGTGSASAILNGDVVAASTSIPYILDAGSFPFVPTDANNGNLSFAAPDAESRGISAGGNPLTLAAATGSFHADGTVITQSLSIQGLLLMGTVVATITETAVQTAAAVQPGETNQVLTGATVVATETGAATLPAATVVTFTLDTAGVVFSTAPMATPGAFGLRLNGAAVLTAVPCSLSSDRTSCSVTVTTKSTAASTITLSGMSIDLLATVAQGATVGVNITTVPAVPVNVVSNTIAVVTRILVGVAAQPLIFINENDQPTGQITLTEAAAGLLTAGATSNYFGLCISTSETFTRAPWAVVTAGNLLLRSGVVGATSVQGTLFTVGGASCVEWVVYSKSTIASTIEIRGSDASNAVLASGANNGPRLSVPNNLTPGATQIRVLNGSQAAVEANTALVTVVSNAFRAFRNQPLLKAVSQPSIPAGSARAQMGDLTICETSAGQFKAGESIMLALQTNYGPFGNLTPLVFRTGIQADYPIVTTNTASGLIASVSALTGNQVTLFITQQATGSLGCITLGNMWVYSLSQSPNGAVLIRATSTGPGATLDQVVSNAIIGTAPAAAAASGLTGIAFVTQTSLGATKFGTFSITTKVAALGKYVTWRFAGGSAIAGKVVTIWKATKNASGTWSAFTLLTSRLADSSGNAFFWWRSSSKTWVSVRAQYPGDATHFLSWSVARQARWL